MNGIIQVDHSAIHWETPKGDEPWAKSGLTLNILKEKYDLQLDPCANNREASMCDKFYTPQDDGLSKPWNVPTIFNPPFQIPVLNQDGTQKIGQDGKEVFEPVIDKWVMKALKEAMENPGNPILGVLPAYISNPWFHDCIWDILPKSNIIPIKGRIRYWDPINKRTGAPNFDQIVVIWRYGK